MMKRLRLLILLVFLVAVLTACGSPSQENAPILIGAEIQSMCDGGEENQRVLLELTFDGPVTVNEAKADTLRLTIGGQRIRSFSLQQGTSAESVLLTAPVTQVTTGLIYLGKADGEKSIRAIHSENGSPAADFEVEGLVPSGVELSVLSCEKGKTEFRVTSAWNIRSIAWIGLYEDGTLVFPAETLTEETLDGYVAMHGHEFLIEDEATIAHKLLELLEKNYSGYRFSCEGDRLVAEKTDGGVLDLALYDYIEVNGNRRELTELTAQPQETATTDGEPDGEAREEQGEDHEQGLKYKVTREDRELTDDDRELLSLLRTSRLTGEAGEDCTELYRTFTLTGSAMPETQIYSGADIEELVKLALSCEALYEQGLATICNGYFGLSLKPFLALCLGEAPGDGLNIRLICADGTENTMPLSELTKEGTNAVLATADEGGPLDSSEQKGNGPICLVMMAGGEERVYPNLVKILIGEEEVPEDPEYGYHDHGVYTDSADLTFTIEVYQNGADYLGALQTAVFTTAQLEQLMREHPEAVGGSYYGTIGNKEEFPYIGVGGWLDYIEGLRLDWLLSNQLGVTKWSGRAEFYDRDGQLFTEIEDLRYLRGIQNRSNDFYIMTDKGRTIGGAVPLIGLIKNGAPVLKDHTHDCEGYIAYSTLNSSLEKLGVSTEVGVVKNHNGPFLACLGNLAGLYGGAEKETDNNCVRICLYLNA